MRASHTLIDGYLTFGVPENERTVKAMYTELNVAANTTNRMMESLKIARTVAKLSKDALQAAPVKIFGL